MKRFPIVIERGSLAHRGVQLLGWLARRRLLLVRHRVWHRTSAPCAGQWRLTLAIAILGLNIVTGYSGQISVGHSAFFGIGAYTTMILVADHGWPFLATLPVGGCRRVHRRLRARHPGAAIRGLYLALITLGLALAFPAIVKSDNFFGIDFACLHRRQQRHDDHRRRRDVDRRVPLGSRRRGRRTAGRRTTGSSRPSSSSSLVIFGLTVEPRPQPRRAGHDRHARQRDRRGRVGRLPRPVQGAGVRHERVRHGRRRGLLLARRDDDRSRHVRPRSGRSSSSPGSSSAASPRSSARRSAGSSSTGSRTCRSRASSSSATAPVGRSRSCRRSKGRRRRSSTASSSC